MDSETDPFLPDSAAPPEVPPGMEEAVTWDAPPAASGRRVRAHLPEGDDSPATALVAEGIEEADRECRIADSSRQQNDGLDVPPPAVGGILG